MDIERSLILYVLEEKGHKEIAEMLGITEHTSSSQIIQSQNLIDVKKINDYSKEDIGMKVKKING